MNDVADIFVGADRSQLLAVAVLEHSIRRHASIPTRVMPLIDLDLPEPKDPRQGSRTNFSFARFAIPELKDYQGRAIYLDADMQVFRDIGELWFLPLAPASINIQEELPDKAIMASKDGAPKMRKKQCAVMLIDCADARWDVHQIIRGLDGQYTYEQLMYEMCILPEEKIRYEVPFEWNSLEYHDLNTRLVHYTDMNTQPWVYAGNPIGRLWLKEVLIMLEAGALSRGDLIREIELGYFRPSLIQELAEMPHERGFDARAARRYADIDADAGFVKHREVNERKKARAKHGGAG